MPFELKPCAFQKWARFDSWPIRQTAFILLGHEPPPLADLFPASNNDYLGSRLTWGDLFGSLVFAGIGNYMITMQIVHILSSRS